MRQFHTLEPIYDKNSKVLILGSFPSIKSRENKMYYSHPQNRFWKVMSILFNEEIVDKDRKEFVLRHKIALWDMIESCEIEGSSDSSIRNIKVNNIKKLIDESSVIKIFAVGKKSFDLYNKYAFKYTNIEATLLPSTSPANAQKSLDDLVIYFSVIKEFLN